MGLFDRPNKVSKPGPEVPAKPKRSSSSSSVPRNGQSTSPTNEAWQQQRPFTQPAAQPAAFLPPPPNWNGAPPSITPPPPYGYQGPWPPIVVNQHYYLSPPASAPPRPSGPFGSFNLGPVVDLADQVFPAANFPQLFQEGPTSWPGYSGQLVGQGTAVYDQLFHRFNDVMTLIDGDRFSGNEGELFSYQPAAGSQLALQPTGSSPPLPASPEVRSKSHDKKDKKEHKNQPKGQTTAVATSVIPGNHFAKVDLYVNSRLPMDLPHLKLYMPTYPLLCLAAQYAERVYDKPKGAERDAHVEADWRTGARAMVIKSVPMDHMNTIVFAIRGTASFMDWAINLNMAPASPDGFLDDPGNFCHSGFLTVARRMVKPVAARLRQLLEEDPGRSSYSLLMTGHSAGGAIASLLYCHMLSRRVESELSLLAGCFRRIHCVTFGTPPVSLLPLARPEDPARPELKKSVFLSFVNEGDPVARADKAYVRSLLELFAAPAPVVESERSSSSEKKKSASSSSLPPPSQPKEKKSKSSLASGKSGKSGKSSPNGGSGRSKQSPPPKLPAGPVWAVPPSTLSCAGRVVVLRSGNARARPAGRKTVEERLNEGVVAQVATDEQLRGVVWGDPVCHVMKLYAGRIETLAVGAVTAQGH